MSRPARFERRLAERRQARAAVDRERQLEELARDLRLQVRSLKIAAGASGPALRDLLRRADELLDTPNTNTSAHVTGERGSG